MRLIFMGTPEAAVPTLGRCLADRHDVVAVWTQPDRPAGRGNRLTAPPVKEFALSHSLTVHQPTKIKTAEALELFASHDADAAVVVAYGRILPATFLSAPRKGCINVHFSLLPKYRGAAPVNWAIVRGEKRSGVTTMQIDEGLDTGAMLLQRATEIGASETAPELMARLSLMGAELLSETLMRLESIEPRAQREDEATHAPVLRREDGLIDWSRNAFEIERGVRGFQPWPNAHTLYDSRRLIVWRAEAKQTAASGAGEEESLTEERQARAGEIIEAHGDVLSVMCGAGTVLRLSEIQPEGKRRMSVRDFLNGAQVKAVSKLG
jgi:methionyl-tRNA formyltransferase